MIKITKHAKRQENKILNKDQNQARETDPEITQMKEAVKQDTKTVTCLRGRRK